MRSWAIGILLSWPALQTAVAVPAAGERSLRPRIPAAANVSEILVQAPQLLSSSLQRSEPTQCTEQEVDCRFLRSSASTMQNEDDDCIKVAGSYISMTKPMLPLFEDKSTVIFGLTVEADAATAWCTDIGWALRKIYDRCRRGLTCYGGNQLAARSTEFIVAVGPRIDAPKAQPTSKAQPPAPPKAAPKAPPKVQPKGQPKGLPKIGPKGLPKAQPAPKSGSKGPRRR